MEKKIEFWVMLIGIPVFFGFALWSFASHLDYFITRKYTEGSIISRQESKNKNGMILRIEYFDINKDSARQFNIRVPYSMDKKYQEDHQTETDIIYTSWFSQYKIKGYKNPYQAIFIVDILWLAITLIGIQYLRSLIQQRRNERII